jgi:hypothetical protein
MVAVAAAMEAPAIISALWLACAVGQSGSADGCATCGARSC